MTTRVDRTASQLCRAHGCSLEATMGRLLDAERRISELEGLVRRLLPGWGSDNAGCNDENYAAFEEARAAVGMTDEEILRTAGLDALENMTRRPESVKADRGLLDVMPPVTKGKENA